MKTKSTIFCRALALLAFSFVVNATVLAWDVPPGRYYYDNSLTKWSGKMWYYVGKSDSGRENAIAATNQLPETDIWYYERMESSNTWSGAEVAYFVLNETTPTRISTGVEAIATYMATMEGSSTVINHCSVGQLYRTDGTFQLMDVFFTFNGGMDGTYELATKISDTEWQWQGLYGGDSFFAVSTNNPTLGNAKNGVGVFEVQLTPTVIGTINVGELVTVNYKTNGVVAAPSVTDVVTISSSNNTSMKDPSLQAVSIKSNADGVAIEVTEKSQLKIYSAQGVLVTSAIVSDNFNYPLNTGFYIIEVNGIAYKFMKR